MTVRLLYRVRSRRAAAAVEDVAVNRAHKVVGSTLREKHISAIFRELSVGAACGRRGNNGVLYPSPRNNPCIPLLSAHLSSYHGQRLQFDVRRWPRSRQIARRLKLFNNPFYFYSRFVFVKTRCAPPPPPPPPYFSPDPPGQTTNGPQLYCSADDVLPGNVSGLTIFSYLPCPSELPTAEAMMFMMMMAMIVMIVMMMIAIGGIKKNHLFSNTICTKPFQLRALIIFVRTK